MNLLNFMETFSERINEQRKYLHQMFNSLLAEADRDIARLQAEITRLEQRKKELEHEWRETDTALADLISPPVPEEAPKPAVLKVVNE